MKCVIISTLKACKEYSPGWSVSETPGKYYHSNKHAESVQGNMANEFFCDIIILAPLQGANFGGFLYPGLRPSGLPRAVLLYPFWVLVSDTKLT